VRIGIVVKSGKPESLRAGAELKAAFDRLSSVGGRPHEQTMIVWAGAKPLAEQSKSQNLTELYFTPGLDAEAPASAAALVGQRIITIAADESLVPEGVILGFELVSGHPKMIFNLAQARRQEVVLRAAAMKLMRIVQ
jgi:hypothetical protein